MEQLRAALSGPHGAATTVTWAVPGAALLIASATPRLAGNALEVAMFLRMLGFWGMVATAPFAVGQLFELRPPVWLRQTHLALAAAFLLLLAATDLVLAIGDTYDPLRQFGPLAVAFLVPVAALAAASLLELQRTWSDRPRRRRPTATMTTASQ